MSLSNPRTIFGIHGISPYNRSTGEFYGTSHVLSGATFSLSGEVIELFGGSSKYSWQNEDSTISAELTFTMKEYPDWAMQLFLGKNPTNNTAETAGDVSALVNKYGTSTLDAATGIASVGATSGDEADLKFGSYVVKVASATTVDLYCSTDIDFAKGTDGEYSNDLLLVEAGIVIPDSGATVASADYGLEFTGGSGTVAMTVGDTATFDVRPINTGSTEAVFGGTSDVYPEFGCYVYAQAQGSGRKIRLNVYRCKAIGMPIGFTANEFSEAEITCKCSFDAAKGGVFSLLESEEE